MSKNADTFAAILSVFGIGSLRLNEAELAALRLSVAVVAHHTGAEANPEERSSRKALEQIDAIRPSSWDAFNYVSSLSHLVYATSLLDTFLTDTTRFLLMLFPTSIGKEPRISIADVVEKSSRSELLAAAASKKARELSYATFIERLADLRRRFGLAFELSDVDTQALEHFSTLRNVAVHDQGFLALSLGEDGEVNCEQNACSRHPTSVSIDDVREAIHTYRRVVCALAAAVQGQVLKASDHELLNRLMESLSDGPLAPLSDVEGST